MLVERVGDFSGCQIGPHEVVTHGVARRAMVDGALYLLDHVGMLGFGLLAAPAQLAHPRTGGIMGQLLEFSHADSDGLRITRQDAGDVLDAAMAQLDGFQGGKTSAVFFG